MSKRIPAFVFCASWRRQVCCAWDLYITMYSSAVETANKITIPSVYVTMKDGEALKAAGEVDVEVRQISRQPACSGN